MRQKAKSVLRINTSRFPHFRSTGSGGSSSAGKKSPDQVNLELVDLSPKAMKEKGSDEADGAKGEKKKEEKLNGDYFVQVNEHKKGLRYG